MTDTSTAAPPTSKTTPSPPRPPGGLALGRWLWGALTSMRTALILLFLLAIAAIPGSLVPQRPETPAQVNDFIDENPTLGQIYDTLGVFNVYTSPWFSAIYLLLLVSLIGCILPRIRVYARALRKPPPATPARLNRLPVSANLSLTGTTQDEAVQQVAGELRRRRFRVATTESTVSAERGYLRELGNLIFHLSLTSILVGVAVGSLWGYKGSAIIVEGQGFSNNLTQYDDITAGTWFRDTHLPPFSIGVNSFHAEFETGSVQHGAARVFEADVTITDRPGAEPRNETLEVNHPATVDGTQIHLSAHGYAPIVEVRDGDGNIAFQGPVVFLPQDGFFTSLGVVKAPDARPTRLAFEGFFLPMAKVDEQGPRSIFPDAIAPELFLNVWYGPPKEETGIPENVYTLDTTGMSQVQQNGDVMRLRMQPDTIVELPDDLGSISFLGWQRWVRLQFSDQPGVPIIVAGVAVAILGLMFSLFIRPRRVWARVTTEAGVTTLVVGGLDRADARTGLAEELQALVDLFDDAEPDTPAADIASAANAGADDVATPHQMMQGEDQPTADAGGKDT